MAESLTNWLRGRGAVPAAELRRLMGVSPATLSRQVEAADNEVLRLGRARATHYALRHVLPGLSARLPVYRVDRAGEVARVGEIVPLDDGGSWLQGLDSTGHRLEGLPPFVHDMAPAGYLGRRFADAHPELALPSRLQDWHDSHRLIAVARRGEDAPGNLIVGEESVERWFELDFEEVEPTDYPEFASRSALGGAGSSAAGEQPKFTAYAQGRHVLVKFTDGDGSDSDRRWRDLLLCEGLTLDTLREAGIPVPAWRIHDVGDRRYLEIERFDRIGRTGRLGVLSLAAIDDEWFGRRDSWHAAAQRLRDRNLLSKTDARTIHLLEAFSIGIANGDRHFGNLVFYADEMAYPPRLDLAPAFDVLPMDLAPRAGEIPGFPGIPHPKAPLLDVWKEAMATAGRFWTRVADDERVSEAMRDIAKTIHRHLKPSSV